MRRSHPVGLTGAGSHSSSLPAKRFCLPTRCRRSYALSCRAIRATARRTALGLRARERILAEHTSDHRANEFEAIMSSCCYTVMLILSRQFRKRAQQHLRFRSTELLVRIDTGRYGNNRQPVLMRCTHICGRIAEHTYSTAIARTVPGPFARAARNTSVRYSCPSLHPPKSNTPAAPHVPASTGRCAPGCRLLLQALLPSSADAPARCRTCRQDSLCTALSCRCSTKSAMRALVLLPSRGRHSLLRYTSSPKCVAQNAYIHIPMRHHTLECQFVATQYFQAHRQKAK